jgi:hypothetical protein
MASGKTLRLSKSQYTKGINCPKAIWLHNFKKEVADEPSEFQVILFKQGAEVGKLAHEFFPNGELIDEDYKNPEEALAHTQRALKNGVEYIFEGAFVWNDILIRVDILKKNDDGTFKLVEVKSTNSLKDHHLEDVAIQKYVLEKSGYKISEAYLMHLNRDYLRDGELSVEDLFVLCELGSELEPVYAHVEQNLEVIRATLKLSREPDELIGSKCNNPYDCEFKGHCWKEVDAQSVHRLTRIGDSKRKQLVDLGLTELKDIPPTFKLTENQTAQVKSAKEDEAVIDSKSIASHLKSLKYPLYYFDFESVSWAVPRYDNTYSYLHLPFQYSLHVQKTSDAQLEHIEFLHEQDADPRRAIAERLCKDLGTKGSIIVFHETYERLRLEHLAELFPELAPKIGDIISRLWDLETPFAKRWYCDWRFAGSSSIKQVLPVMVPKMSYEDLDIQNGSTAAIRYEAMIMKTADFAASKKSLLEYCKRDTLAMMMILKELLKTCPVQLKAA